MENKYEHLLISKGHKDLFGDSIPQEELFEIISQYPAILWLDLLAKIEGFLVVPREKDFNAQVFLANNLFCPSALERISRKSNIGAVFFSLGQLNLARKLVIVYGSASSEEEIDKVDISKVLLTLQDLHNQYDKMTSKRDDFENFCKFVARNGYLNTYTSSATLFYRARKIYVDQASKLPIYPNISFSSFFADNVGMSPEEAIALNFALTLPFFQKKEVLFGQTSILNSNYFEQTTIDSTLNNSIIESMAINFDELKEIFIQDLHQIDFGTTPSGYDLSIFRKTPLIRLPDSRLVCASLTCLLEKSTQNAIWMPLGNAKSTTPNGLGHHLTHYRGLLFEEYLKELCLVMVEKNKKLIFNYISPEDTIDNEEVGDSILIKDNNLILFEAKSRQFLEVFKFTGDWDNDPTFITEFIKASQQIDGAASKIISGSVTCIDIEPQMIQKIYPVVVTYESVPMHGKMQRFIRQKVQEAGYLVNPIFAPLEVMTIDDIENSIDAVDTISLVDLLVHKHLEKDSHASESNFYNFFSQYLQNNRVNCNGWQSDQIKITRKIHRTFLQK